jgi:hypothetical protein
MLGGLSARHRLPAATGESEVGSVPLFDVGNEVDGKGKEGRIAPQNRIGISASLAGGDFGTDIASATKVGLRICSFALLLHARIVEGRMM